MTRCKFSSSSASLTQAAQVEIRKLPVSFPQKHVQSLHRIHRQNRSRPHPHFGQARPDPRTTG